MDVINDKEGKALTKDDKIKKRWAEYCEDLYKKPQDDNSDFHHTENESEPPPLRDVIRQALNQLANGKSTGVELPAELWKATGELGIDLLWKLCKAIWEQQEWPTDWCRAVFLPIYKKGIKKECSNHR